MLSGRKPPDNNTYDRRTRSSAMMKSLDASAAKKPTLHSTPNNLAKSTSSKTMGVPGYRCAKFGLPDREPQYTIPKDENQNFFKHVTRSTKGVPAPSNYYQPLSWKTTNGTFGVGPARKTFTDDAAKLSKQRPSPATYNPELKKRLLLGQMR